MDTGGDPVDDLRVAGLGTDPLALLSDERPAAAASDVPLTGDDSVDEAVATLGSVASLPVREHVRVFDAVHGALSDRLAESGE